MEPLTDVEKDRFVQWLDAVTAQADEQCAKSRASGDKYTANKFRLKSIALQMVAILLRTEQVNEAAR